MKIAIIGAGTCGLYLAWKLAKKGEKTVVFEKRKKIGKETCSGLFSERILDLIPESKKLIQNKIDSALIHLPKKTLKIKFSRKFLVMNHYELDNLIADLAEKSGSKIFLNHNITEGCFNSLQKDFEKIIGCDGANSVTRKFLKQKEPHFRLGIQGFFKEKEFTDSQVKEKTVTGKISDNSVETWATESGFIWKIPRIKNLEYGIIEEPVVAKKIFNEFLNKNKIPLDGINSAFIPQGLTIPSSSLITLCGDSSGLTKPWSGGGVVWQLTAANLLLQNFPDFLKYKKAVEKFFSAKIIFSKTITRLFYFLGFKAPWLLKKEFKIESDFLIKNPLKVTKLKEIEKKLL